MRAGFCKQVITPPLGQVAFAGYNGRQNLPHGVLDELYARALVLQPSSDPSTWIALVTTDLFMLRRYYVEEVRALANKLTSIPGENICIHATHSHQGPDTLGIYYPGHDFDGHYLDEAWLAHLARQLAGAVYGAIYATFECRVGVGEAALEGMTLNRRDTALFANPPPNPRTIDPQIPLIRVDDLAGNPRVLVTGFATHPTFLGGKDFWSAEHVPFLEAECRRLLSSSLEVMYFTGQAGDVIPSMAEPSEHRELVINPQKPLQETEVGITITSAGGKPHPAFQVSPLPQILSVADGAHTSDLLGAMDQDLLVQAAVSGDTLAVQGPLTIKQIATFLGNFVHYRRSLKWVRAFVSALAAQASKVFRTIATSPACEVSIQQGLAEIEIDDPDMGVAYDVLVGKSKPLRNAAGKVAITTEVQAIRVGEACILCLPSEPINEIGLRLKHLVRTQGHIPHVFCWELCNDAYGYLVTPFEHDAAGYEVTVFCFGRMNGTYIELAALRAASRVLGREISWAEVPLPEFRQGPWSKSSRALKDEFLRESQKGKGSAGVPRESPPAKRTKKAAQSKKVH